MGWGSGVTDRLHILFAIPTISWLIGAIGYPYASRSTLSGLEYFLIFIVGLVACPFIAFTIMRELPDFFEWENSGPRDFFLPALATASLFCLLAGIVVAAALAR